MCAWCASATAAPNIVLITVDNLRADRLGCYGYERDTSPNMDRLAAQGTRFESFYAQSCWTSPGVISLFTGLYPPAHGVDRRGATLPESAAALPEILAGAGWNVPTTSYLVVYANFANLGFGPPPSPDWNGRHIEDMLEALQRRTPEPFFAWFHYKWVHLPYDPPIEDLRAFREEPLPAGPGIDAVRSRQIVETGSVTFSPEERRAIRDLYDGEVRRFDRDLGRLLAVLEEREILDRTIIIVTADHGEELFDHGFVGHGSTAKRARLYEEQVRVPLVMRCPALVPEGRVVRGVAEQVDLMPTLLEILNLSIPQGLQGASRLSAIRTGATIVGNRVYAESIYAGYQSTPQEARTRLRSVFDGRWRLIHTMSPDRDVYELYDLRRDPGETRNLAAAGRGQLRRMKRELARWADRCHLAYLRYLRNGQGDGTGVR